MPTIDSRIVQFVAGLRAAGVRVSLAESQDAVMAAKHVGLLHPDPFACALRATLIKEHADQAIFERLFPLYFGSHAPPLLSAREALTAEEVGLLEAALQALEEGLHQAMERLLEGQPLTPEELENAARRAGMVGARDWSDQRWLTRQMLRELGLLQIFERIQALLEQLEQQGMSLQTAEKLRTLLEANAEALAEQARRHLGASLAEHLAETLPHQHGGVDLVDRPFHSLDERQMQELRKQAARLAARLRTRAALRQKRGKGRFLDAKATLRSSVRYGGVPFEIVSKLRRRKAKFTVLCDVSTSMRRVVYFLLLLLYQLQDQVSRTRTFAYIDRILEISDEFDQNQPKVAVPNVLKRLPAGHYNTDLGKCLSQFAQQHLDAVDGRTTVIICGDGRNNYNASRSDLIKLLARRSRKIVWFNPEPSNDWGTGDSDMLTYAPLVDAVFQVTNLRQLSQAIDRLFL